MWYCIDGGKFMHITYPPKNYEYPNCGELFAAIPLPNRTTLSGDCGLPLPRHSRDTILAQLQNQETERARRSDWLREAVGFMNQLGRLNMLTLMKWWSTLTNHWIFGGTREDLARILMPTGKKMIQNEVIAHKIGESTRKRLTSKLRNCLAELYPRKIGPALDKFTWCCFYLLFVCVDIFWNTLKYSKQQNDRRPTGVFKDNFPFWNRHFETKFAQFQEFLHFLHCIPNDLQCFIRFLVLSPKFPYEFMVPSGPSVPSVSPMICAPFPPPVSGIRGTFGKRLSDDGEAAAVPGFGQRSTEDFGSKPTFQRWTLHQFADPWGGEWRGFQDVPRNSENLEFSNKSGFRNFVINSSGRCRVINIWRTTGSEKSPRTLVCVLCPMACDLTYSIQYRCLYE